MPAPPRCTVVIPHLRGVRPLLATLHALDRVAVELDVVLVDNASTDGSVEEAVGLFENIRVVRSRENLGYAGGANLGLEHARAPWCVFLNDDAVPAPGAIESLVDLLESADGRSIENNWAKDNWVYTGRDSLIELAKAAKWAYENNYNVPQPPQPPDVEAHS